MLQNQIAFFVGGAGAKAEVVVRLKDDVLLR